MVKFSRKPGENQLSQDLELLAQIEEIKSEHPFWGYRRVWATLKFKHGLLINIKRVERVMRLYELGVNRTLYKAKRTPQRTKPRPEKPCEWWGIDMTKIMTESGWVYIVLVLDWYSKVVVGYHAGYQSRSKEWQQALDMAVQSNFPHGVREQNLNLMSDNGCQPTSLSFMKNCSTLDINQAFTSYNNPKGNADTERMMRTLKEELLWLNEWRSLEEIQSNLKDWIYWYNNEYLHSKHGYKTPQSVHDSFRNQNKNTPLIAA